MQKYEQIVQDWYYKLRSPFINYLKAHFPSLYLEDIEDIYQESFLAVYKNIQSEQVRNETSWKSYIFQIGINKAKDKYSQTSVYVHPDSQKQDDDANDDERLLSVFGLEKNNILGDDDDSPYSEEVSRIALEEISSLPEPCETILKDYYFHDFSMDDIAKEIHYLNSNVVKAKKNQCMNKLKERMHRVLLNNGFDNFFKNMN